MTFIRLLAHIQASVPNIRVCSDSRDIKTGDVFVAVVGTQVDGHDYIDKAIENGASFIVCHEPPPPALVPTVVVDNSAKALGLLAQAAFANPASKLTNLAVTGTNGKTTVCYMVRSIINASQNQCGLIGTIIYDTGKSSKPAPLTTPDAIEVAHLQHQMVINGTRYMAIEASSHALDQNRLAGINFTAAAFTNLTGDHLDYHKTEQQYLKAKTALFTNLPMHAIAILNAQSPHADTIARQTNARVLWYAIDEPADIIAKIESMDVNGTTYKLSFNDHTLTVKSKLTGLHNISNQLAAAGLCIAAGFDLPSIAYGLSTMPPVPGRLEAIKLGQPFSVLIDYAHTDDALKNVLQTLKPLCKSRLITVFGCGGDRDKTKRPRMAAVAEKYSDIIIVTSDNPRTEPPLQIIDDITAGLTDVSADNVMIEPDRMAAIQTAINKAETDDIVLIAGKGHEDYQIIGTTKIHCDDKEIAVQAISQLSD